MAITMLCSFVAVLIIVCLVSNDAFRLSHSRKASFTRLLVTTTTETAAIYQQIKEQLLKAIDSKTSENPSDRELAQQHLLKSMLEDYGASGLEANIPPEKFQFSITNFLRGVKEAVENPHQFEPYHKAVRAPFDYYSWGNDFFRPLIIEDRSKLEGLEQAQKIKELAAKGENIIILSNHQTEADPQVISLLLEQHGLSDLAEKIVFIAGHKVTNDPVAIPFSMGRNLICIHSKKHIKNPPEEFATKQAQNLASMAALSELLGQGGSVIWVAPSGGRDRPEETTGKFVVAPFDFKALDMFKIIAMQSKKPAHFFPMAMYTHQLVPPPKTVSSGLGESRSLKRGEVSVHILPETDGLGGLKDKEFAADVQKSVEVAYEALFQWHASRQQS